MKASAFVKNGIQVINVSCSITEISMVYLSVAMVQEIHYCLGGLTASL